MMQRLLHSSPNAGGGDLGCMPFNGPRRTSGGDGRKAHFLGTFLFCLLMLLVAGLITGCVTAPQLGELNARVERGTGGRFNLKTNFTSVELPPEIAGLDRLSEADAVAIALWNNAAFWEALATLGFNRADLLQAKQLRNPTLIALFPAGPKQFEFAALFPVESLWLRPRRVAVAEKDLEAATQQLVATGLDLIRNVRLACAELELASNRVRAFGESVQWQERLTELAARRFALGDASALEQAQAQAAVLLARQALTRLERDEVVARERLRQLLGLAGEPVNLSLQLAPVSTGALPTDAELFKRALAARPEIRANELGLEAARKRGQLAAGEALLVSAMLDGNDTPAGMQFGPGLDVTLPVLHQNQGPRTRAETQVQQAIRRHLALRDRILLEVREAVARRKQAVAELSVSRDSVLPALESAVAQTRQAYELGDASPALFIEAERQLANARNQQAEAIAEVRRAEAELARALGHRFEN